jgi:hypothetical protein
MISLRDRPGSLRGGQMTSVLLSFTSTCQRLGAKPWANLQDVLMRFPMMPAGQLGDLRSDRLQAARQVQLITLGSDRYQY